MKKIAIIMIFALVSYGFTFNDNIKCVDIKDFSPNGLITNNLSTKIQGKKAISFIEKKCIVNNLKIDIVDDNNISLGKTSIFGGILTSEYYKVRKKARYKIEYDTYKNNHWEHNIDFSSDKFCIRPYKYIIDIKSSIFEGRYNLYNGKAYGYNGNLSIDYNSTYQIYGNVHYNKFNIYNNNIKIGLIFLQSGNNDITLIDEHYCDIDINDTSSDRRYIIYNNSIEVKEKNKNYLGVSTKEIENNPNKNNIKSDIRQNHTKDLKFNRIGW